MTDAAMTEIGPGIWRIVAPNPSPMTFHGTNTYLVGQDALAVIDPGPQDAAHLAAILAAIGGRPLRYVLVTHSHRDHSPLARALSTATGAPVLAFGASEDGRSPAMAALARSGLAGGGEGVDTGFGPDRCLADGERLAFEGGGIEALWTPGHMGNHLCFAWGMSLFSGDLVMGWASSMVSPPDGDLAAFRASLARLRTRGEQRYFPGHGEPVDTPAARIDWLLAHRAEREAEILAALAKAPRTIADLTAQIYSSVDPALWPAASRNVLAHLVDLTERRLVQAEPDLSLAARFSAI